MNNMSVSYLQFLVAIVIIASILIYGYGKQPSSESIPSTAAISSSDEASSSSKKEAKKSHPIAKPGAAVNLKSTEPLHAAAPGAYEYQVQLVSPNSSGKMIVNVSANDGVDIVSAERQFEFELQENGEYTVPLKLYASSSGRFYIQFNVAIVADEKTTKRVISAIFQVGEPLVKTQKTAAKSASSDVESVISLPAQETISPR